MHRTHARSALIGGLFAFVITCSGCHSPDGALMSYNGASQTLFSTETSPKTVRLIDVRSGEVIFESAIPVGKQFTYRFEKGGGDDPQLRPDQLRYQLFRLGTLGGKLTNALSVPNQYSRKVEFVVRDGTEYAELPPEYRMRTDRAADRPDWWTPKGGPMESDARQTMYDN